MESYLHQLIFCLYIKKNAVFFFSNEDSCLTIITLPASKKQERNLH